MTVTVHRVHGLDGHWFLSVPDLRISQHALREKDIEAALTEAIHLVHGDLLLKLDRFRRAAELPSDTGPGSDT